LATSWRNKKNYPLGTGSLSADITNSTLSIALNTGQGANFPSATFTITIDEEIILIDSRSTDTLTVNASGRGYDSTTASAHAAQTGVYQYQIAKDFTDIETAVNGIENGTTTLAKVVTSGSAANTFSIEDAGTTTVIAIAELYHRTSGTAAAGLGAKVVLGSQDTAGNQQEAVSIQGILTTATSASEAGKFLVQVMSAGSATDAIYATATEFGVVGNINSTASTQTFWYHTPASGGASVRICPMPSSTSNTASIDFFRQTNTSTTCDFNIRKGDNSSTAIYSVVAGSAPKTQFKNASGTVMLEVTHGSVLTFSDAMDMAFGTSTGTKIGTGATQKLAFWNKTPVVQPASANQAALTDSSGGTADGTVAAVSGSGADSAINNNFKEVCTLLNQLRNDLVTLGLIKGSA